MSRSAAANSHTGSVTSATSAHPKLDCAHRTGNQRSLSSVRRSHTHVVRTTGARPVCAVRLRPRSESNPAALDGVANRSASDERDADVDDRECCGYERGETLALIVREIAGAERELRAGKEENDAGERGWKELQQRLDRAAEKQRKHDLETGDCR